MYDGMTDAEKEGAKSGGGFSLFATLIGLLLNLVFGGLL
jgi:hypothetical protein